MLVASCQLLGAFFCASISAQTPASSDCVPNRPAALQSRLEAAAAAPTQFLPKLEIARCYDLSWRMADVEPAILNALAALRVEARTKPITPAPLPAGAHLAGVEVPALTRLSEPAADYPAKAYLDGVTGVVIVETLVDKDGKVKQAKAVESVRGLDDAAVQAVKKWRFAPANQNGQMVDAVTYVPVRFGQTRDLWASDWMQLARFYFLRGLPQLAEGALEAARDRAQRDYDRYGEISGVTGTAGRLAAPPTRAKYVVPTYPPAALNAGASGVVLLQVLVDRFGTIGRVVVLKPGSVLDLAAQQGVMQWKYTPAHVNGQPVSMSLSTVVSFNRR